MKTNFFLVLILPICLANKNTDKKELAESSPDYSLVDHDLPNFNLFKAIGHWALRATSDRILVFPYVNLTMEKDKVIGFGIIDDKLVGKWQWNHRKDSNLIDTISIDGKQPNFRLMFLHQGHRFNIVLLIRADGQSALKAYVRVGVEVDNQVINKTIEKLLTKSSFKTLIKNKVKTLEFLDKETKSCPERDDFPISDEELVDVDFTSGVANWTLRALSTRYINMDILRMRLVDNNLICHFYSGPKQLGFGSLKYICDTRLIKFILSFGPMSFWGKVGFLYVDYNFVIMVNTLNDAEVMMAVMTRSSGPFDVNQAKKIINNQLLFSRHIRRYIKDLVPKLVFT